MRGEALFAAGFIWEMTPYRPLEQPTWRDWLLGDDWPRFATALVLRDGARPLSDDTLAQLQGLTQLKKIDIGRSGVTDAGLANLRGLTGLEQLVLGGNPITDAGLVHLRGLRSLKILSLDDTQVTDAGLANLNELSSLQQLGVQNTGVTNDGVRALYRVLPRCTVFP